MTDINQCDVCRVGAPISERGNHIMPDGGYMGCTRKRYAATDLPELKAELQYCLDTGTYGQRTGLALQWALDALNEIEEAETAQ
jgi:hypothetical protein